MKKNMQWMKAILACFLCVLFLTGCDFGSAPAETRTYFTDSDGNAYYIINENHFLFDSYNVLEVIVSETEKFILYDTEGELGEAGIGEWIKDGISYPISFMDYDREYKSGKHGNIVITPYHYHGEYWEESVVNKMPPVLAMIHNDQDNPGLYRWSTGAYPYNWKFEEEKIPVKYFTYKREDLSEKNYIPEKAAKFYSLESDNTSYVSEELSLSFHGKTGKGTWTLNDVSIPITAAFDQNNFTFSVQYDTTDERQGILIFTAQGTSANDMTNNQATYTLTYFPKNCNYETITALTIKKITE